MTQQETCKHSARLIRYCLRLYLMMPGGPKNVKKHQMDEGLSKLAGDISMCTNDSAGFLQVLKPVSLSIAILPEEVKQSMHANHAFKTGTPRCQDQPAVQPANVCQVSKSVLDATDKLPRTCVITVNGGNDRLLSATEKSCCLQRLLEYFFEVGCKVGTSLHKVEVSVVSVPMMSADVLLPYEEQPMLKAYCVQVLCTHQPPVCHFACLVCRRMAESVAEALDCSGEGDSYEPLIGLRLGALFGILAVSSIGGMHMSFSFSISPCRACMPRNQENVNVLQCFCPCLHTLPGSTKLTSWFGHLLVVWFWSQDLCTSLAMPFPSLLIRAWDCPPSFHGLWFLQASPPCSHSR